MPIPSSFQNKVILVEPTVDASTLNAVISAQNALGFWVSEIKIMDSTAATLLFSTNFAGTYGFAALQKVNLVTLSQAALDADAATELANDYVPTGMFMDLSSPGSVYILYQQIVDTPL